MPSFRRALWFPLDSPGKIPERNSVKQRILKFENQIGSPHISAAVEAGGWLYLSGQGPLDFATRAPVRGTIEEETELTLEHVRLILERAGCTFADVVKCTCYLADLADFPGFNTTYQSTFTNAVPPARTTVQALLLSGIKVEIDAIVRLPEGR